MKCAEGVVDEVVEDDEREFHPLSHLLIPGTRPVAHFVTSRLASMASGADGFGTGLSEDELWDLWRSRKSFLKIAVAEIPLAYGRAHVGDEP